MATNNSLNNSSAVFDVTVGNLTVSDLGGTYGGVTLATASTGVITHVENPTTDGQLLISKSDGSNPIWANLTEGSNIVITNAGNSITIAATNEAVFWTPESTSFDIAAGSGYIIAGLGSGITATLPATAAIGDIFEITDADPAWNVTIAQNALQYIQMGNVATTPGVTGYLATTSIGDSLRVVCIATDIGFQVLSSMGNITVA
jgi:hypothetical protein